jgi:hypothetical protein
MCNARHQWDIAETVSDAIIAAREYATFLAGPYAAAQREEAAKWMTYGGTNGFPDDFCFEQAALCARTADNAMRHARAWTKWAEAAVRLFHPDASAQ